MNSKFDAIVLKTTPYKENDLILSLLTPTAGRIDAIAKGAKKSRKSLLYTEQFAYSSFDLYRYSKKGLFTVDAAEIKEPFYELRKNLSALCLSQYFAEICYFLPKESDTGDEQKVMSLLLNSLYILCKKPEISLSLVKAVFELKFSKFQGFEPDFSSCALCGKKEGALWVFDKGILCKDCAENAVGHKINETVRKIIFHILSTDGISSYSFSADEKTVDYVSLLSEKYFLFTDEREYKTLEYFKEISETDKLLTKGKTADERNQNA